MSSSNSISMRIEWSEHVLLYTDGDSMPQLIHSLSQPREFTSKMSNVITVAKIIRCENTSVPIPCHYFRFYFSVSCREWFLSFIFILCRLHFSLFVVSRPEMGIQYCRYVFDCNGENNSALFACFCFFVCLNRTTSLFVCPFISLFQYEKRKDTGIGVGTHMIAFDGGCDKWSRCNSSVEDHVKTCARA